MDKDTLCLFSLKDLEHYRQTLVKRINGKIYIKIDLKTFNIELGK